MSRADTVAKKTAESKKLFIQRLQTTYGIVSDACRHAGVSRMTYYNWCKLDPDFKQEVDNIIEERIDLAEGYLLKRMREGSDQCITFFLRTVGRKRGYAERQELTGVDGEPLAVQHDITSETMNRVLSLAAERKSKKSVNSVRRRA
jgi:hypothetical protein